MQTRKELEDKDRSWVAHFDEDLVREIEEIGYVSEDWGKDTPLEAIMYSNAIQPDWQRMSEGDVLLWRELKEIKYVLADISTHLSKIADKEDE